MFFNFFTYVLSIFLFIFNYSLICFLYFYFPFYFISRKNPVCSCLTLCLSSKQRMLCNGTCKSSVVIWLVNRGVTVVFVRDTIISQSQYERVRVINKSPTVVICHKNVTANRFFSPRGKCAHLITCVWKHFVLLSESWCIFVLGCGPL